MDVIATSNIQPGRVARVKRPVLGDRGNGRHVQLHGSLTELDPVDLLEIVLELEKRLRIASLRIAIEGKEVMADIVETLAQLAAFADDKLQ